VRLASKMPNSGFNSDSMPLKPLMPQECAVKNPSGSSFPIASMLAGLALLACLPACAHEVGTTLDSPGFRPASEHATAFVQALPSAKIAVLPTILRTAEGTHYLPETADHIAKQLPERGLLSTFALHEKPEIGPLEGHVQWDVFVHDMEQISSFARALNHEADYLLAIEFLITQTRSGGQAIGGIHCYILDAQGRNAFSFLLNSHHKPFVQARLNSQDPSHAARSQLLEKATDVTLQSLSAQLEDSNRRDGEQQLPKPEVEW
jgi:hypothetical protein